MKSLSRIGEYMLPNLLTASISEPSIQCKPKREWCNKQRLQNRTTVDPSPVTSTPITIANFTIRSATCDMLLGNNWAVNDPQQK